MGGDFFLSDSIRAIDCLPEIREHGNWESRVLQAEASMFTSAPLLMRLYFWGEI
jgi:hypothetical protein